MPSLRCALLGALTAFLPTFAAAADVDPSARAAAVGPLEPSDYTVGLEPIDPDEVFQRVDHAVPVRGHHSAACDGGCDGGGYWANRRGLADKHGPAGIMGDHVHDPGEVMVEYRYMNMYMDTNRIGHRRVSDASTIPAAPGGFVVDGVRTNNGASPTQMTMEMHMLHLMYGVTEDVTVYTMLMFPSLTMDHIRGPANPAGRGTSFTTQTSGLGDTSVGALVRVFEDCDEDVILNIGGSLPSGEIFSTSSNPTGGRVEQALPYPMRRGSGTFNFTPGVTWKRYYEHGSLGSQFTMDLPVGRNYRGYRLGETYRHNLWYSHLVTDDLAFSVRLENIWRSNIQGSDPVTNDAIISTNVEQFRGGYWLNLGIGGMLLVKGHLLNVEFVPTLYQDLEGIQLGTDWTFVCSWSKSF